MGEFFRGWKRQAGLVTLVMACVFAALWMRSLHDGDVIWMKIGGEYFTLRSGHGKLQLNNEPKILTIVLASKDGIPLRSQGVFPQPIVDWLMPHSTALKLPRIGRDFVATFLRKEVFFDRSAKMVKAPWWQTYRAFDKDFVLGNDPFLFKDRKDMFGRSSSAVKTGQPETCFSLPYWSIILPLTLLSGWLLLSKPRSSKSKTPVQTIEETVA